MHRVFFAGQTLVDGSRRGAARGFFVLLLLVVVAAFGFAIFVNPAKQTRTASKFQGDWKLISLKDGQPFSLASLRGKVLIVNLWATWCPPCVAELPTFQRLYDKLKDDPNYAFAFISMEDTKTPVENFIQRTQYTFPVYIKAEAPPPLFDPHEGIPKTIFIAKDGRIAKADSGYAEWDQPWVIEELQRLAAEPSPTSPK